MQTGTCLSCDEPAFDCKCGATVTYETENGPTCPFCGELNKASDSDGRLYDESITTWSCDSCGNDFDVGVSCSYTWTAARPAD